jgi:hypothetical protein
MSQTDFINLSPAEINSFKNTVKAIYELDATPSVPEFLPGSNLNQNVELTTNQIKGSFSGSLGFGGVNIAADSNFEFYAMDIMKSRVVQGTPEGPVLSATYGVGCRIILKIKKTDISIDVKLPQLAAQTELGLVDTSIAIQLKGFGSESLPEIPDDIFTFSEFDMEKYTKVNDLINNVVAFITNVENEDTYEPVLIGVELKRLYSDDIEDVLINGNYALWRIKKGDSLKEAIELATENSIEIDEDIVRRTYALIMQRPQLALENAQDLPIGNNKPKNEEESRARDLLVKYRRVTKKDA